MDKCWIEFSFLVPAGEIDLISDRLYELGCIGVNVEEKELDTFVVPGPEENLPEQFSVRAFFDDDETQDALVARLVTGLGALLPGLSMADFEIRQVFQEDWAEGWKQHFSALRFGPRLVVKPTWEEWDPQGSQVVVSLDPGMAFGTGSHETTRLCLQALADRFEQVPTTDTVLDVGTGSGILAIAAAALGATQVAGCEIDVEACRVARENVALNRVDNRITVTDRPLEALPGCYDLVIANILAEENVRLADQLVARLAPGAELILSGILKEKEAFVRNGFDAYGLDGPEVRYENDWCCIIYRRGEQDG